MKSLFYHYSLILSISAVIYKIDQITAVKRMMTNWNEQNLLIGSFSKYTPFNNFENVGEISRSETNSQLIYAGLDLENQNARILHFVEFNEQFKQIKHVIKILTLSQQIQEEFLIDYQNYEGQWISQYMYFNEQQLIIGIKQQNGYQQKQISTNQFGKNEFLLILGGSLKILDSIPNQTLLLSSFQGFLSFYLEEEISILDDKNFISKCVPQQNDQISSYFSNEGGTYTEFSTENEYVNSFFLQFWMKILPSKLSLNQILRLSINKSSNFIGKIGSNSVILNYEYLEEDLIYYFEYYSYDFPIINESIDDPYKQFFQESISIQFINEWHLIQVKYLEKQLIVQLENFILKEQKIKIFGNVNQFTNTKMKIYFGGNQYQMNQNKLEIGSVKFQNCLDNNYQIQYCHNTCKTCYGPFRSQCLSCFVYQNRIYDNIQKSCNCKQWHYENQADNICIGQEQKQYLEIKEYLKNDPRYDENEKFRTCAFGYFLYNDECIQCPSASQKNYIICINCLINPDTWIYEGKCGNLFIQEPGIENAVYNELGVSSIDILKEFILIDNELSSCGYCDLCSDSEIQNNYNDCFLYPFKHVEKSFYITCRYGYDAETFKCKYNPKPFFYRVCESNCGQCNFDGSCKYCKSPTEYFFTWERKCRLCKVKNCKYCFQYNRYDHSQVSVNSDIAQILISQNEEDYIMACALCNQGYVFNFQINECVLQQVNSPCINGYIDENLQFVCTNSLGIFNQQENNLVSQFHDCLKYFTNCQSCIQDSFKMIYCIKCFDGYYLDYHNGLCQTCSQKFENSRTCKTETSSQDSWKYDLVSFYLNFIPNSTPIQLIGNYYFTEYILLECKEGFLLSVVSCIPMIENRCAIWHNKGYCSKCQNLDQGYDAQTFFYGRCQICPYPCRFCVPISDSTINQINPYFIINEDTKAQTYKCLLNQNQNETFIHHQSGQQLSKDTNNQKFLLSIQKPQFPDSPISNAQAYIDFEYLKRRKVSTYIDNYNAFREEDPINLRAFLFFIFNSTVLYDGYNDTFHEKQISIINQTTVNIQNVKFYSQKNQIIISSQLGVSIYIHNITLHNQVRDSPLITITNFTYLFIQKLDIYDITLLNTSLFNLNQNDNQTKFYSVVIQEIILKNCIFLNSSFIYLFTKFYYIDQFKINKIILNNCSFENSQFNKFVDQLIVVNNFVLQDFQIINSNLINSEFILLQNSNFNLIDGIIVQNCKFNLSTLLSLNPYSILNQIEFYNIILYNSVFIIYTETIISGYKHKINELYMESILICGKNPIKISQNLLETSSIEVKKVTLNQIQFNCQFQQDMQEKKSICIFDLQSNKIDISLIRNDQINNYWILCINNSNIINIDDIHLNSNHKLKYDPNKNYSKLSPLNSGFLYLKQFITATFSNIIIKSQSLLDSSMIYINSKNEQQIKTQSLKFLNVVFENNLLIKIQSFSITTLLYVEFEGKCIITISNITFISNYIRHLIFDYFTISPSLICIITQSLTQLQNAIFYQNENVNSCFPSVYIKSSEIQIENITVQGVNVFNFDLISYFSENNIFNYGGFSYLYGLQITIIDSKFENELALEIAYFYIYLYNQGNMKIINTSFHSIIVSTEQDNNYNRAVFEIDATSSNLNFEMNNVQITNLLSRYSSGFLKISPSRIKNQLQLNNIKVKNVLSQHQHFLDLTCINNVDNSVQITDFSLILEKEYFQKYNEFVDNKNNLNQLSYINIQGMIIITNSSIIFQKLHFSGFAPITILCLLDNSKILINNLIIEQIEVATKKLNIIQHEYSGNQLKIINLYLCYIIIKNAYSEIDTNVESFFEILQNFPKRLILRDSLIINNTCQTCKNGLIYFQQIEKLLIHNLIIYNNQCGLLTCLMLNQVNQNAIKQSKFIRNSGTQGGALNIKATKIQMKNILFLQNDAENGGAFYLSSTSIKLDILIQDLYLIQNKANIGGAIYLENHNFRKEELLQVYFLKNIGQEYIDNIRENPSQLKLSIFNQELDTKSMSNIGSPNFEKYKLNTNIIYIPSGQQINNYSIQNLERQVFIIYNLNPKLYAINNLGEKQINLQQYKCVLKQQQNYKNDLLQNQEQIIPFNQDSQSFDFSNLIINLDPYIKNETIFVFDCDCFTESQYKFYLSVKSFPCQVGEFYYFNQCIKCEESKGFYSVEPKATFCQKIDPNIIQENTASEISLQPGYWRPNYRSKFINKCTRQKTLCLGGWKPGDQSCNLGYIGALCEECDIYNIKGDGQYYKNKNNKCVFCSDFGFSIFISLLFGSLTIGSMILTVSSVNTIFKSFLKLKLTSKHYKILFNHSLDQSAALIKTVVNYFQILVRIKSFQLELYFNIIDILTPLSNPISTSSYTYECFLTQQTELHIIYISLIINILAPIFFYFIFLTVYMLLIFKKKLKLTPTIYATAIFYLFFYAQPNIILELGELITSRNISEIQYINRNVSILYFTKTHISWVLFFITPVLLIIGIIIPLILFLILYKKRYHFNQEKVRKIWGYIFNDYKESSFYWEIFRVSEREIILLSLIIFEEQIEIKGILTFLILFLYHIIVQNKKPFNMETLNRFEQKCITLSSLIFLICGIKYQIQILQIVSIDFILQTLLLIVFIIFFYILISQTISTYYQKYNDRLDGIRKILLQRFPKIIQICPQLKNYLKLRVQIQNKLKSRVKLVKEALIISKGENIMQSQHHNLLSFSLQKSIYPEEQAQNLSNLLANQKNNEKEKTHFVKDLVSIH